MGLPGPVGSALKFGLMDDGVADATVSFSKRGIASGHLTDRGGGQPRVADRNRGPGPGPGSAADRASSGTSPA